MGTSLTVHPFAALAELVDEWCPRLLLNLERVGGWGSRKNDVAHLKQCDDAVKELAKLLGWEEDLQRLWEETRLPDDTTTDVRELQPDAKGDELVEEIVEKLADELGSVGLEDKEKSESATDAPPQNRETVDDSNLLVRSVESVGVERTEENPTTEDQKVRPNESTADEADVAVAKTMSKAEEIRANEPDKLGTEVAS